MKSAIALTMWAPNGVGPEVVLKFLKQKKFSDSIPVWTRSGNVFEYYSEICDTQLPIRTFTEKDELENGNIYLVNLRAESDYR